MFPLRPNERAESGNASCYEVVAGCQGGKGEGEVKGGKEGGLRHAGGSDLPIVCADRVLKSSALCAIVPSSVFTFTSQSLGA